MKGQQETRRRGTGVNMTETTSACDKYPLHKAVFEGNLRKVSSLLRDHDIDQRDCHGKFHFNFVIIYGILAMFMFRIFK